MSLEQKFEEMIQRSQQATLSAAEKNYVKDRLLLVMRQYPVGQIRPVFWQTPFLKKYLVPSLAVLVVVIFAGVGMTVAAQNALPGDLLYPIKTGITEKIVALTKVSDEQKVQYDLSLVQKRLEEVETATAENKLSSATSADVKKLLDNHIADLNAHVKNINKNQQPTATIEADSDLEASLNAHTQVLNSLSNKAGKGKTKDNIDTIVSDLYAKSNRAVKMRQKDESDFSTENTSQGKTEALITTKLQAVNQDLQTTTDLIANNQTNISAGTATKAQDDIKTAADAITQAKTNMDNQQYDQAFILLQTADRNLVQVQLYVGLELKLNKNNGILNLGQDLNDIIK